MPQQTLTSMLTEHYYLMKGKNKDEDGEEFEWINMETVDGMKKIKKYKNKNHI